MRKLKLEELNRVDVDTFKSLDKHPIVLVLDNIRSAMNIGSFFRTADSFALEHIYLTGISAKPPHPEINKTAIGATLSVDWTYDNDITNTISLLKTKGYLIIGIEQTNHSVSLESFSINTRSKIALVFGNEVSGISVDVLPLLDHAVEIPQFGTKHSLNVAVCGGIVIWDLVKTKLSNKIERKDA